MASLERFVLFIPEKLNSIRLVTNKKILVFFSTAQLEEYARVQKFAHPPTFEFMTATD